MGARFRATNKNSLYIHIQHIHNRIYIEYIFFNIFQSVVSNCSCCCLLQSKSQSCIQCCAAAFRSPLPHHPSSHLINWLWADDGSVKVCVSTIIWYLRSNNVVVFCCCCNYRIEYSAAFWGFSDLLLLEILFFIIFFAIHLWKFVGYVQGEIARFVWLFDCSFICLAFGDFLYDLFFCVLRGFEQV